MISTTSVYFLDPVVLFGSGAVKTSELMYIQQQLIDVAKHRQLFVR